MNIGKCALLACVSGAVLALGACNSSPKAGAADAAMAVKADNTTCPFSNGPISDAVTPVAYKGKNVGFCCAGCAGKFAAMTEAEKDATLAKAASR